MVAGLAEVSATGLAASCVLLPLGTCSVAVFFGVAGAVVGIAFFTAGAFTFGAVCWPVLATGASVSGLGVGFLRMTGLAGAGPGSAGAGVAAGVAAGFAGLSLGVVIAKTPVTCYWNTWLAGDYACSNARLATKSGRKTSLTSRCLPCREKIERRPQSNSDSASVDGT